MIYFYSVLYKKKKVKKVRKEVGHLLINVKTQFDINVLKVKIRLDISKEVLLN